MIVWVSAVFRPGHEVSKTELLTSSQQLRSILNNGLPLEPNVVQVRNAVLAAVSSEHSCGQVHCISSHSRRDAYRRHRTRRLGGAAPLRRNHSMAGKHRLMPISFRSSCCTSCDVNSVAGVKVTSKPSRCRDLMWLRTAREPASRSTPGIQSSITSARRMSRRGADVPTYPAVPFCCGDARQRWNH